MPGTAVLITAGFQVPVIGGMFVEAEGNTGAMLFWQSGPIAANVGVICGVMVITMIAVVAHCPASGVKV